MKKLIFILLFLPLLLVVKAEPIFLKTVAIDLNENGKGWQGWVPLTDQRMVVIDFSKNNITILTETPQIYDYVELKEYSFQSGKVLKGIATDTDYDKVIIELYIYDVGTVIFKGIYSNFQFKYRLSLE